LLKKKKKWGRGAGGVCQVVEHLPSKCDALSSNSSTAKKKKLEITCKKITYICNKYIYTTHICNVYCHNKIGKVRHRFAICALFAWPLLPVQSADAAQVGTEPSRDHGE
jgi:hypothetical protein